MLLRARAALTVLCLATALGAVPTAPAKADSAPYEPVADAAFRAGEPAPEGRDGLLLPDGALAHTGTVAATTRFGDVLVERPPGAAPSGYVAVTSADGSSIRWMHDLGFAGLHPTGLATAGTSLLTLGGPAYGRSGEALLVAWDSTSGASQWAVPLGSGHCTPPELAVSGAVAVVAGSFAGSLELGPVRRQSDDTCDGFVAAFDTSTGALLWDRQLSASRDVMLQQAALTAAGDVLVGGLFSGTLELDGAVHDTGADQSHALLMRLAPTGRPAWSRTFPCPTCWLHVEGLVVDGAVALVRTGAPLSPGWWDEGGGWLSGVSVADGSPMWQVPLPRHVRFAAPLVVIRPGEVMTASAFDEQWQLADQKLTSRGGMDVALVRVGSADGRIWSVDQLGGTGDDLVNGLAAPDEDLLLTGRATVLLSDGAPVTDATVALVPRTQRVVVRAPTSDEAGSVVRVVVESESGDEPSLEVAGPCALQGHAGAQRWVRLEHVGTCTVTATVRPGAGWPPGEATAVIEVRPATPQGSYDAVAGAYPGVLSGSAWFRLADGRPAPGTVSYDPPTGTALGLGTHTVAARFTSADPDVADAVATRTVTVAPAAPRVMWDVPDDIVFGTSVPASALDAVVTMPDGTAVAGTYRYTTWERSTAGGSGQQVLALGAQLPAGAHSIELAFTSHDPRYQSVWTSRTLHVLRAETSLAASGSLSGLVLRAALRDVSNDAPLAGREVVFTANGTECTGVTDADGTATCPITSGNALAVLLDGFDVRFAGGPNHLESAAHGRLT